MGLNKSTGNMYKFITDTWNPIHGKCSHKCDYCYMKRFKLNDIMFDRSSLKTDLGTGKFIFIGSSTDMWAKDVPTEWLVAVLDHIYKFQQNKYLFQSKNPARFYEFLFPTNVILGTTIETDFYTGVSKAPPIFKRFEAMLRIPAGTKKMVSIEPILCFDVNVMDIMISQIKPLFVSIGADSKGNNLSEPSADKIKELINRMEKYTKVIKKPNLKRLIK